MEKLLLGIDLGTSGCKAAVFYLDGIMVSQVVKGYRTYYPEFGHVEQNPEDWWNSVCEAVNDILKNTSISAENIAGVGIDGQSWSAVPVDRSGNVLYNTPIWMDTRADGVCRRVAKRVGADRIFEISGNSFEPTYTTPKNRFL